MTDAARLALLHLGDGAVDGMRLISGPAAAAMRAATASGGPVDVGLGLALVWLVGLDTTGLATMLLLQMSGRLPVESWAQTGLS